MNSISGFTSKYKIHHLVYYEEFEDVNYAILSEKQLKKWERAWKVDLIEKENPEWLDLYDQVLEL
jgi:putative endonuclease